ncbi:MAG: outer membrane lipoprotein-sorting protein [Blastocatellia bacterium]
MNNRLLPAFLCAASFLLAAGSIGAAAPGVPRLQANAKATPTEILAASAEKGRAMTVALRDYTYYIEMTIQTVSQADTINGKFYRFSQISFDRDGKRQERIIDNTSTLPDDVHLGTNAANNLARVYQFILTPESLNAYEFNYVGRERVDELNTYVFDVEPKVKLPDPEKSNERYLRGRIWIDDQDLCVVKVSGVALPEQSAHRTPKFETFFQNVDQYWFPSYVAADDIVHMGKYSTRVVVKIHFTTYKKVTKRG